MTVSSLYRPNGGGFVNIFYLSRMGSQIMPVRLYGFRHISSSGSSVRASMASFIAFLHSLAPDIASLNHYGLKRCSATLLPVLVKPEVVSNGLTMADRSIFCIKMEWEVGYREFDYAVSAIFLLLVWPQCP